MLERNRVRDNLESIQERLGKKGYTLDTKKFQTLDKREKSLKIELKSIYNKVYGGH